MNTGEEQREYSIAICSRVAQSYLSDLVTLYTGKEQSATTSDYVQSVTNLNVTEIIDPSKWFKCIQWSYYRCNKNHKCLELFITRPSSSSLYYAVGEKGTLLVNRYNLKDLLKINDNTVDVLTGQSKLYCLKPTLKVIDVVK